MNRSAVHAAHERSAARSPVTYALLGHAALAFSLFWTDGANDPGLPVTCAILLAILLFGVLSWGRALHAEATFASLARGEGEGLALVVAFFSVALGFVRSPGSHVERPLGTYHALLGAAAFLLATYVVDVNRLAAVPRALRALRRASLFVIALALGAWLLRASPDPQIDLFPLHQQTAEAALAGRSIYAPGAVHVIDTHGHVYVIGTYTYLPLSAYLTTIGFYASGDIRWANCVAELLGGAVLWLVARRCATEADRHHVSPNVLAPAIWADLVAASLVFHPRALLVLEKAWVEPLALPFLGGFVLAALARRPILASVCLGLLCAIKQHLVLYVPFLALVPGVGVLGVLVAGSVALGTLVPELARSPLNLYRGVFTSIATSPPRNDSFALPADLAYLGLKVPPWIGFASALAPFAWIRRIPRRLGPLLLATCLVFALFYVLGRQAFCNYYYLLDATALFAVATLTAARGPGVPGRS